MPKFGEEGMDPKEMGARGAAVRAANKEILEDQTDPLSALQHHLLRHRTKFAEALRKAALGEEPYDTLPVEKQMEMLKVDMYYTFGRPQMAKVAPPDEIKSDDMGPPQSLV